MYGQGPRCLLIVPYQHKLILQHKKRSFRAVLQLACMTLAFTFPLMSFTALCNTVLLGKSKAILIIAAKSHASAAQSPARLEQVHLLQRQPA